MEIPSNNLKVAIVTDFLWTLRGSERMVDVFLKLFPNSDVYALLGKESVLKELKHFKKNKIIFSWLNKFPFIFRYYRYTYFLWPLLIEQFKFINYDLVISISTSVAKGVIIPVNTYHLSYINSPMRYAWDLKDLYFNKRSKIVLSIINIFLHFIRIWDVSRNNQIDYLIANSKFVKERIEKYYAKKVDKVIYPFFDEIKVNTKKTKNNFYLYHGALEPNKGAMEVVHSAIKHKFPLVVSGTGSLLNKIQKESRGYKNIKILGWTSDSERNTLYNQAKALIFPSYEDFGIVGLEALSVGIPVLALKYSGIAEVITKINGVLIENQNPDKIFDGIKRLEESSFNKQAIINSVKNFKRERFEIEIKKVVEAITF